ncbi:hypothetical protein BH23ACT12_BH23ACT12_04910 [soil metagenome]
MHHAVAVGPQIPAKFLQAAFLIEPLDQFDVGLGSAEKAQSSDLEANKRATAGDYTGAIDLAVRVVDELLRALGCEGTGLTGRLQAAEKKGLKEPVLRLLNQLSGLRAGGDTAASPGPAEAMLAIHLAASVCHYLKTVAP